MRGLIFPQGHWLSQRPAHSVPGLYRLPDTLAGGFLTPWAPDWCILCFLAHI